MSIVPPDTGNTAATGRAGTTGRPGAAGRPAAPLAVAGPVARGIGRIRGPLRVAAPIVAILASMSSVQMGAAISVPLFATLGVAGTTWVRLVLSAIVLLAVARPHAATRRDLLAAGALGVVMAANAVAFSSATDRIPLGVTVAVEFCGPACVAALGARGGGLRRLIWPACALAGVVLLTRPWAIGGSGAARTWTGLGFAVVAGTGWAGYIVLTAHVGRRTEGLTGLSVALSVAALALAPWGAPQAWPVIRSALSGAVPAPRPSAGPGSLHPPVAQVLQAGIARSTAVHVLALCALAAVLVPLAAYALEMVALRRLDQGVFGVWMALEPALGAVIGALMLGQRLALWQLPAFALVVGAGIGAAWAARSGPAPHGAAG